MEGICILLVYGVAFSLYVEFAWLLLGPLFLIRGCLIRLLDNVFQYEMPLKQSCYAHNLYLPVCWSRLILHFNLLGIHPNVSCWQLSCLHAEYGHQYQGRWMRAVADQFKEPVSGDPLKNQ